jgi:predicted dehydrogenase
LARGVWRVGWAGMRVLILGYGSIARKHVAALREIEPGVEVVALRSGAGGGEVEGVRSVFSLDEVGDAPDFVVISNPTVMHGASILEVARFGCPLFVEKPVLGDLGEATGVLEVIRERGLLTYTACNLRFHPVIGFLKGYLADGGVRVNEVNVYCGSYLPDWRPGRDFREVYSAREELAGGVHLDLIHELDYCTWLFGMPERSEGLRRRGSSLGISAADFAGFRLLYPGFTASVTLNYYRRDARREIEIVGEDGTVVGDLLGCRVSRVGDGEVLFEGDGDISRTYVAQMRYFLDAVARGEPPMNSVDEAVEVLRIALHGAAC